MHFFKLTPLSVWNCALLGCYAAGSGNSFSTFQYNLSVNLKMEPETSARNCYYLLPRISEVHSSLEFWRSNFSTGFLLAIHNIGRIIHFQTYTY
jgi:hypothetical protein